MADSHDIPPSTLIDAHLLICRHTGRLMPPFLDYLKDTAVTPAGSHIIDGHCQAAIRGYFSAQSLYSRWASDAAADIEKKQYTSHEKALGQY